MKNQEGNKKTMQVWETRVDGLRGRRRPRIEWKEHIRN